MFKAINASNVIKIIRFKWYVRVQVACSEFNILCLEAISIYVATHSKPNSLSFFDKIPLPAGASRSLPFFSFCKNWIIFSWVPVLARATNPWASWSHVTLLFFINNLQESLYILKVVQMFSVTPARKFGFTQLDNNYI